VTVFFSLKPGLADDAPAPPQRKETLEDPDRIAQLRSLYEKAVSLIQVGDLVIAKQYLIKTTEINSDFFQAYELLGRISMQLGQLNDAQKFLEQAVFNGSENANTYFFLGIVDAEANKLEDAERCYLKAIEKEPQSANIYHELGLLYYREGRFNDSLDTLNISNKLQPNSPNTLLALGLAYIKVDKPEGALESVTTLRAIREEEKATHLENLIRDYEQTRTIPEPQAANLTPSVKAPAGAASVSSPAQVQITGHAQLSLSSLQSSDGKKSSDGVYQSTS